MTRFVCFAWALATSATHVPTAKPDAARRYSRTFGRGCSSENFHRLSATLLWRPLAQCGRPTRAFPDGLNTPCIA